ncbi:MAG: hypothetical protein HETSPECPRED_008976 [Heterodermia speciosa]|uniref:FHA domain-containing protein n=1 Tax=Heterodermia speciosa TaxID=116794 RepID=A0A8H3IV67_9LECA|nr:MAG: hypothetical protein HETSPECPRED_008976 [Heterodermia speciosa]
MESLPSNLDSSPPVKKSPASPFASARGTKRPAPSLLPPFEPFPSPSLPRPAKRQARASPSQYGLRHEKYPTPIPTSSTGIAPSSSPPQPQRYTRRSALQRTNSTFSERAPLSTVPTIELDDHSQPTLMGRSSNSSHYQLSTNKLISRVHVRAVYLPASLHASKRVVIECVGWNGVKVHCQGRAWELRKGDSFTSETEDADIMVDVHDARVLLRWPRLEPKIHTPSDSDRSENSPRQIHPATRHSPAQSPLRHHHRLQSPVSPSPAVQAVHPISSDFPPSDPPALPPVQVYEDEPVDEEIQNDTQGAVGATQSTIIATQPIGAALLDSIASDFSDADEENDPVVHSFGPYGANLMPRMESFTTGESTEAPRRPLNPLKETSISPQRQGLKASKSTEEDSPIVNHVINQLAYSRLASTPLSTLMDNLPVNLKLEGAQENARLTKESLKTMVDAIRCIGKVSREGKDAAGKALESEYYYIADLDAEEKRRNAVEGLQKPGLRACRKQHKQYYWRKPK